MTAEVKVGETVLPIVEKLLETEVRNSINAKSYGRLEIVVNYGKRPEYEVKIAVTHHY